MYLALYRLYNATQVNAQRHKPKGSQKHES